MQRIFYNELFPKEMLGESMPTSTLRIPSEWSNLIFISVDWLSSSSLIIDVKFLFAESKSHDQ